MSFSKEGKSKKSGTSAPQGGATNPGPMVAPTPPANPLTPFNWNSATGRQPMNMEQIMGAVMPLAGQTTAPQYTSPAAPFSGNFWETVVSPDTLMRAINSAPKDASNPLGFDPNKLITQGKSGTPSQSTGKDYVPTNPAMMQKFMESGMMDKLKTVFSPGGVNSASTTGGAVPFY